MSKVKSLYKEIAKQKMEIIAEVEREMQKAIDLARIDPTPEAQSFWKNFQSNGEVPTPDEFIKFLAAHLLENP